MTPPSSFAETLRQKLRFHVGRWLASRPGLMASLGWPITIVDQFGTPGDTILTALICQVLKTHYPRLRVHCRTPNPVLLQEDPNIEMLNGPETWVEVNFHYLDLIGSKDGVRNLLEPTLGRLGVYTYQYQSRVFLTEDELSWAREKLSQVLAEKPLVTINVQSREQIKVWSLDRWCELVRRISKCATVVQLGGTDEPQFAEVVRLAGALSMRQSMAILAQASVHVGPVSFLMHAANGLDVPSVIIFGGRETPSNSGYDGNINLYSKMSCSPCWLHDSRGDRCPHSLACMEAITVEEVEQGILKLLSRRLERKTQSL
ncbi:MAG: ADP-heptose:LPS heptosyltransferase [Verrucomicrobia bacterium]|nr:MAG: ADP-heptose:LPS heptosyltransferase [Verrucomicrobiota bacterium]